MLNHAGLQLQFVLVAGGDEDLYARFKATEWHSVTQIYNYTDQMPQFMHASDLIIGKAGGSDRHRGAGMWVAVTVCRCDALDKKKEMPLTSSTVELAN